MLQLQIIGMKRAFFKHRYILLLVCVVVASFFFRLDSYNHEAVHLDHPDVKRDFIVVHQMITYHELPLAGPNGHLGSGTNSPFYYYLIAVPVLFFGESILVLQITNLILQSVALVFIFLLIRNVSTPKTALVASVFFGFFTLFVNQATYIWQPHIMQVVLIGSLLALSHAYVTKKIGYVFLSIILFSCGTVIHNSLVAFILPFALFVFLVLWKLQVKKRVYVSSLLVFLVSELILFLPVAYFYAHEAHTSLGIQRLDHTLTFSVQAIADGLMRFHLFIQESLFHKLNPAYTACIYIVIGILSVFYFRQNKNTVEKSVFLLSIVSVASMIFVAGSVTNLVEYDTGFPSRYFTPIFIPLVFIISVLCTHLGTYKKIGVPLQIVAVCGVLFLCSSNQVHTNYIQTNGNETLIEHFFPKSLFTYEITEEIQVISSYIDEHNLMGKFDISTMYWSGKSYVQDYSNDIIWEPLIAYTQKKYLILDSATIKGYRPVGTESDSYLILKCWRMTQIECREYIQKEYRGYVYADQIYFSPKGGPVLLLKNSNSNQVF